MLKRLQENLLFEELTRQGELSTTNSGEDYLSYRQASDYASKLSGRVISPSNISYLVQYGQLRKYGTGGPALVKQSEINDYYRRQLQRETNWKKALGDDLNWRLSFDQVPEKQSTKHVHRLHSYKGKFIPQLVEYFLDQQVDDFKPNAFFKAGDIVLDPFCGSGTTMVQANEMGIHAIGVDVSAFNCLISRAKLLRLNPDLIVGEIATITEKLDSFNRLARIEQFDLELQTELTAFNSLHFPNADYKYRLANHLINENDYAIPLEIEFKNSFDRLINKYNITLNKPDSSNFLEKWFFSHIAAEITIVKEKIDQITDVNLKSLLMIILSRTMRSCRATRHYDLGTLKQPQLTTYYCTKHNKVCKPLFSIKSWFERYAMDTVQRLQEFDALRKPSEFAVIEGDSRAVSIEEYLKDNQTKLSNIYESQKIKGIFSSPPYVGQIDYHEQHAYAYELFKIERRDDAEIGPLFKGKGKAAQQSYVQGISSVLNNFTQFLADDFDIFLVANDKFNLYPEIVNKSHLKIVNQFKRPVLNRSEGDKNPYAEIIFHIKKAE